MVGLKDLGEAAWAIEQTLNLWLRQELPVTPDLLSLLQQSCEVLGACGATWKTLRPAPTRAPWSPLPSACGLRRHGGGPDTFAFACERPGHPASHRQRPHSGTVRDRRHPGHRTLEPIEANFNDIVPELGTASNLAMEFPLDAVDTAAAEGSDAYDPAATQVNPELSSEPGRPSARFRRPGASWGRHPGLPFAREHEEFALRRRSPGRAAARPALAPSPPARQESLLNRSRCPRRGARACPLL
ncbi:MAG: hypothetical protein IPJ99_01335 [Betaproteobacteria bacterium]|nr:hypothetical protein [Betaproteobacteria bacterium]